MTTALPVAPLDVVKLTAIGKHNAMTRTDLIETGIIGAMDDCESLARETPQFRERADLLFRKLLTLKIEASALKALADAGCAPADQS